MQRSLLALRIALSDPFTILAANSIKSTPGLGVAHNHSELYGFTFEFRVVDQDILTAWHDCCTTTSISWPSRLPFFERATKI